MIGSFGEHIFEVSSEKVKTFSAITRELGANYASHEIINGKPLLQATGQNLMTISIEMNFRADLGVNPLKELQSLKKSLEDCRAMKLFIGDNYFGSYVIEKLTETYKHIDNKGRVYAAGAAMTLKEYN